jgi:hypothetical protein
MISSGPSPKTGDTTMMRSRPSLGTYLSALALAMALPAAGQAQCNTTTCNAWRAGYGQGDSTVFLDNSRTDTIGIGTIISNCDTNDIVTNKTESVVTRTGGMSGRLLRLQNSGSGFPLGYDTAYVGLNKPGKSHPRLDIFDLEANNLFNFDRYRAAALATNNNYALCPNPASATCTVFDGVSNVTANNLIPVMAARQTMYGVVRLILTPGLWNSANPYWCNGSGATPNSEFDRNLYLTANTVANCGNLDYNFDGEINVKGTIMIDTILPIGASSTFQGKVNQGVPLNVNWIIGPVSGSKDLSFADYDYMRDTQRALAASGSTAPGYLYPSGYIAAWNEIKTSTDPLIMAKNPFALTAAQMVYNGNSYQPFRDSADFPEDLPAVMYTGGFVDMHNQMNVSGLVYTPNVSELNRVEHKANFQIRAVPGAPNCSCWCGSAGGNNRCFVKFINGALVSGIAHTNQAPLTLNQDPNSGTGIGAGTLISLDPATMDYLVTIQPQFLTKSTFRVVE